MIHSNSASNISPFVELETVACISIDKSGAVVDELRSAADADVSAVAAVQPVLVVRVDIAVGGILCPRTEEGGGE